MKFTTSKNYKRMTKKDKEWIKGFFEGYESGKKQTNKFLLYKLGYKAGLRRSAHLLKVL